MPELRTDGLLKMFVKKTFEKDGQTVDYHTAYFLCGDEEGDDTVLVVNTKKDLTSELDKHGRVTIRVRPDGKLSLISFET